MSIVHNTRTAATGVLLVVALSYGHVGDMHDVMMWMLQRSAVQVQVSHVPGRAPPPK
jgi:hypothetical protein